MEKRRKSEKPHWVTPGVFSGAVQTQERLGQEPVSHALAQAEEQSELIGKITSLEQDMQTLQRQLQEWEKKWAHFVKASQRDREHLYQVVLSLKKEWEMERDENRHR
ncbi:hypothetical protein G3578_19390 [Brevibacillus sp. SYP-B805]|uniref:hypothetical protein n=1 Tax=Brevibacillus sp. SYP-B805 TaxID=1578199 RepID=UPI0013EDC1C5|nr:hypothetical protein [Brevibacillus sp. SYP-B805]NGQ97305.1 hypothetical protein [Brevibacillus sp. SYP-B805]